MVGCNVFIGLQKKNAVVLCYGVVACSGSLLLKMGSLVPSILQKMGHKG